MRVREFGEGAVGFERSLQMAQERPNEYQDMYVSRSGDGPVMVCVIQMGQIHGTLSMFWIDTVQMRSVLDPTHCGCACTGASRFFVTTHENPLIHRTPDTSSMTRGCYLCFRVEHE